MHPRLFTFKRYGQVTTYIEGLHNKLNSQAHAEEESVAHAAPQGEKTTASMFQSVCELNYGGGELRKENLNSLWGETGITPLDLSTQSSFITCISDPLYYGNYN